MRLLLFCLLAGSCNLLKAQCTPPVTIQPIPNLCSNTGFYQLNASPSGGVWSGTNISPAGLVDLKGLLGFQTAQYVYADSTCTDTVTANFQVLNSPSVNAGTDFTIVCGGTPRLNGSFTPGPNNTASWSTDDGHLLGDPADMNVEIDEPGTYVLTAVNNATGCINRDTVTCFPHLPSFPHVEISATICAGDTFLGYTTSGDFYEKYEIGPPCDSFRVVHLTVLPSYQTTMLATTCDSNQVGTFVQILSAANGCDSTITTLVNLLPSYQTNQVFTTCDSSQAGTFVQILSAANGCDSTITTIVELEPLSFTVINQTICSGEIFEGYTEAGSYLDTFPSSGNCDSLRLLQLSVLPLPAVDSVILVDNGPGDGSIILTPTVGAQPFLYTWSNGDSTATITNLSSGNYSLTLTDAEGCSTVLTFFVDITVKTATPVFVPLHLTAIPNPVRAGKVLQLQLLDAPSGNYRIQVCSPLGQVLQKTDYQHSEGTQAACMLQLSDTGIYLIQVIRATTGQSAWIRVLVE